MISCSAFAPSSWASLAKVASEASGRHSSMTRSFLLACCLVNERAYPGQGNTPNALLVVIFAVSLLIPREPEAGIKVLIATSDHAGKADDDFLA